MLSTESKKIVGNRLKEFAEAFYGNMAGLARKLGVSQAYFTSYISGRSLPGGEVLIELYNLGCNINWLLTGQGEMEPVAMDRAARQLGHTEHPMLTEMRQQLAKRGINSEYQLSTFFAAYDRLLKTLNSIKATIKDYEGSDKGTKSTA